MIISIIIITLLLLFLLSAVLTVSISSISLNLVIDMTVVLLRNIVISIRITIWGCCLIAQFGWRSARLDSSLQVPGHLAFK